MNVEIFKEIIFQEGKSIVLEDIFISEDEDNTID